jgi:hypothetical protein
MEYDLPGGFTGFGHGGATLSFYTSMVTIPELGLGVFVTTNTDTGRALVERLPSLVVGRFYAPPPPPPAAGSPALQDRAGDFAGGYLTTRRAYAGLEGFASRLVGGSQVRVSEDGRLLTPSGDGVRAWIPDGPGGLAAGRFRAQDSEERLVFQMEDGRAVGWYAPWGGAAYERQGLLHSPALLAVVGNLTLLASLLALGGAVLRLRRSERVSGAQSRATALELVASVFWIVSAVGFAVWALRAASDSANALYGWPGPWLLTGSAAALLASLVSLVLAALAFTVWRSDRHGWSLGRRVRHTITAVLFLANAALLASWGALEPWSA